MKIGKSRVVEIHFTLKNESGEVLDTTVGEEPHAYLHGYGNLIQGMEDVLENLEVGSSFDESLAPEKAYGVVNEGLIKEIPRENFPPDFELQVGQQFMADTPNGQQAIYIKELREATVIIDGNHELAGETIYFSGEIVSIREATAQEIEQGGLSKS